MNQPAAYRTDRVRSIDLLRGIIMIIMALDHVRDYIHVTAVTGNPTDLATTTIPLFLTRWITHFCAPLFVFLSGISAYLNSRRKTVPEMAAFLMKRGLWLVVADGLIISLVMTFNPTYSVILLQVIWAIGWGMLILGLLLRAGYKAIAITGIVLFFGHNLTGLLQPLQGPSATVSGILLTGPVIFTVAGKLLIMPYPILPWAGVMMLGFAFGKLFGRETEAAARRKKLLTSGVVLTALFLLLRFINIYGDPSPWSAQASASFTVLSFLNVTKYPPSLQFCCMTIGPGLVMLSLLDRWNGRLAGFLEVYGKVPFFYFLMHFLLIHLITVVLFFATGNSLRQAIDPSSIFLFRPANWGFGLGYTYLLWFIVVLLMYYPCRRYMRYKASHNYWWLSYV
ncbi:MAG: DUF1624 domain-containing protein [Chitinophagaceae bacterium]|nr:MAG: DUF1624 domain-containing protein [Chitinophagaceae bacterium]